MRTYLFKSGGHYKLINNSEEVMCERRRGSEIIFKSDKLKPFQFLAVLGKVEKVFGWMVLNEAQINLMKGCLMSSAIKSPQSIKKAKDAARNDRMKYFLFIKPQLECNYQITEFQSGYHIHTEYQFGKLSYFPKGDKLQFCDSGKWLDESAIEWIEENLNN